jgi:hypothetical protein
VAAVITEAIRVNCYLHDAVTQQTAFTIVHKEPFRVLYRE